MAPTSPRPGPRLFTEATVAGHVFDVWVGRRGEGPAGYNPAPVVTFAARQDISSGTFELRDFFNVATNYGISASMYVTDIHFGFEIWQGGAGGDLGVDKFECRVD